MSLIFCRSQLISISLVLLITFNIILTHLHINYSFCGESSEATGIVFYPIAVIQILSITCKSEDSSFIVTVSDSMIINCLFTFCTNYEIYWWYIYILNVIKWPLNGSWNVYYPSSVIALILSLNIWIFSFVRPALNLNSLWHTLSSNKLSTTGRKKQVKPFLLQFISWRFLVVFNR